jgi:DNA polymerase phi
MMVKEKQSTDVLVEIILGLLSKPSNLLRKLSGQVFASFVGEVSPEGLKLLLDVLMTPETTRGAEDLFENEMEEDNEDDDDGDDDDEDEDEDSEGEDDLGEEMDVDSPDEELNAALSAALGTTSHLTNDDASSEEEDLMNDDEMLALDDSLVTIFRQRLKPNRTKEAKDTKLQISTFKCKVIDLLEILVKQNHLCLEMVLPLLQVLRSTKNEVVHAKTLELLRKLAKSKDLPDVPENLMSILRKIHEDAATAKTKEGNVHSQLSIYIARIARKANLEEDVVGVYSETMRKWIKNRKSMVKAGLFADWVNWCQSIRK